MDGGLDHGGVLNALLALLDEEVDVSIRATGGDQPPHFAFCSGKLTSGGGSLAAPDLLGSSPEAFNLRVGDVILTIYPELVAGGRSRVVGSARILEFAMRGVGMEFRSAA